MGVVSQHAWLKEDLRKANENRQKVPWIVVHGHRSLYCSCDSDCDAGALLLRVGLEELLFENGVDFFFNGHEHNCAYYIYLSSTLAPHPALAVSLPPPPPPSSNESP